MKVNSQVLPLSPFLRQKGQVYLEDPGCISSKIRDLKTDATEHLARFSNFSTNADSTRTFKTDYNRRARNVISSRKYRKKRKIQYMELERDNRLLQQAINEAEKVHHQVSQAFHKLIQHAECCDKCCNIKLCFE
ncbi:uncharacterized protein LOC116290468 [Actinia tenebrosa]|uniref:Uncharacterized protein LOC116290468 n=1 Tax=Actinia tenebrosa TaxID=6105 RepID=A0A6P8HL67_ACTTE|nr:uncharacterized protein LOC116290468 [Actinia tenebrosa]